MPDHLALRISNMKPLSLAQDVSEVAEAFHMIVDHVPSADAILATLYAYLRLRPNTELRLLLHLISSTAKAKSLQQGEQV